MNYLKYMKYLLPMVSILIGVAIWYGISSPSSATKSGRCYILVKSNYQSQQGRESVDSVVTLSFSGHKGVMVLNSLLTTTDDKTILLYQSMGFSLSVIRNDEFNLNITSITNRSLADTLPANISPYMRNILNTHFISPEDIRFRMEPFKEGGYMIFKNLIPWAYCNRF